MYKQQGNLRNAWYILAQSKTIKSALVKKEIMGIPLVTWRTNEGKLCVLEDRCTHRNAPLSEGKILNNCVVCPYHGWEFDSDGHCVNVPSEGGSCSAKLNYKVRNYPLQEKYGYAWIWMGQEKPLNQSLIPMNPESGKGWSHFQLETEFDSNVSDLVENFMDVPHTAHIHKGLIREEGQLHIKAELERTKERVAVSYQQPDDSISFFSRLLNPGGNPLFHTDEFLMPNIVRVNYSFGKYSFWTVSSCTPVSPNKTISFTSCTFKFGLLNGIARLFLPWYVKKILKQDVWIMKKQSETVQKFGESTNYRSTQADSALIFIQQLRESEKKINENGKIFKPLKTDIEFWV